MKRENQTIQSAFEEAQLTFKQKLQRLLARYGLPGLVAGVLALGATGCSLQGGGWIQSLDGNSGDKATFGFNITNLFTLNNVSNANSYFDATGDLTVHDKNYITADFPHGVNVHAGTNWFVIGTGNELNAFITNTLGTNVDLCDLFTNELNPVLGEIFGTNFLGTNDILNEIFCGTNNLAIGISKCTFARGGNAQNGNAVGTLVAYAMDTGQTGAYKGDQVGFVIYPFVELDPDGNIDPTYAAYMLLFTLIYPEGIPGQPIYSNVGTIGNGGPGGGNVSVNGIPIGEIPVDLGGSWVAVGVLVALVAGALAWRRRRLRSSGARS